MAKIQFVCIHRWNSVQIHGYKSRYRLARLLAVDDTPYIEDVPRYFFVSVAFCILTTFLEIVYCVRKTELVTFVNE